MSAAAAMLVGELVDKKSMEEETHSRLARSATVLLEEVNSEDSQTVELEIQSLGKDGAEQENIESSIHEVELRVKKNIRSLCIQGQLNARQFNQLCKILKVIPFLFKLSFENAKKADYIFTDAQIKQLVDAIRGNARSLLVSLSFHSIGLSYESTIELSRLFFKTGSDFFRLSIVNNLVKRSDPRLFTSSILNQCSLTDIDLSATSFSLNAIRALVDALRYNHTVLRFSISLRCDFTDNSVNWLMASGLSDERKKVFETLRTLLSDNTTLECLELPDSNINNTETAIIASGLSRNANLTEVNLARNQISDDGLKALADAIRQNLSALKRIDLRDNNIEIDGVQSIIKSIQFARTQKKYTLIECHVELEAWENAFTPNEDYLQTIDELKAILADNSKKDHTVTLNWAKLAPVIGFIRAHRDHSLRFSILALVPIIVAFTGLRKPVPVKFLRSSSQMQRALTNPFVQLAASPAPDTLSLSLSLSETQRSSSAGLLTPQFNLHQNHHAARAAPPTAAAAAGVDNSSSAAAAAAANSTAAAAAKR